jgi:hypothetical protein
VSRVWLATIVALSVAGCAAPARDKTSTRVDPDKIRPIDDPAEQARIGPPEVVEPTADAPNGIALRMDFAVGSKIERRITGDIELKLDTGASANAGQGSVKTKLDVVYTLEAIEKRNDVTTVRVSSDPLTVTGPANASKTQAEVFELKVDPRGRIVENLEGLVRSAVATAFVPFPTKKVEKGAAWSVSSLYTAPVIGEVDLNQTYVYKGTETRGGKKCWRVDTVGLGGDVYRVDGSYWFESSTGLLLEADWTASAKTDLQDASGAPTPGRVTMSAKLRPRS